MNDLPLHKGSCDYRRNIGIGLSEQRHVSEAGATVIAVGHDPAQEPVAKRELGEGGVVLTAMRWTRKRQGKRFNLR